MRRPRVRFTVRRAAVVVATAAVLLVVVIAPLVRRRDGAAAGPARAGAGVDASALGGRRAVEVEGGPLVVDGYAAFPALGDFDGDGRPDLLLGDPRGFLKVYRNVGGPGRFRLAAPVRFGDFSDDERIPTG